MRNIPFRHYILLALFASCFANIRYLFISESSFAIGQYSDLTSIFLYLTDLLIIGYLFFAKMGLGKITASKSMQVLLAWISVSAVGYMLFGPFPLLALNLACRLILTLVTHETVRQDKISRETIYMLYFILGMAGLVLFSLTLSQIRAQESIGGLLKYLGEPIFSSSMWNIAKITTENGIFIRPYALFAHPNSAAFSSGIGIISSSLFAYYLYKRVAPVAYALPLLYLVLSLLFFSRGTLLALLTVLFFYFIIGRIKNLPYLKQISLIPIIIIICFTWNNLDFFTRNTNKSENPSTYRQNLLVGGARELFIHPLTGLGIGSSMLHMKQSLPADTPPWDIQPIHNYLLITQNELGLIGLSVLLYIFMAYIKQFIANLDSPSYLEKIVGTAGLALLLFAFVTGLFDHYLYTQNHTIVLFWLVLGIILQFNGQKQVELNLYDTGGQKE
jgi:hypothetical protein